MDFEQAIEKAKKIREELDGFYRSAEELKKAYGSMLESDKAFKIARNKKNEIEQWATDTLADPEYREIMKIINSQKK